MPGFGTTPNNSLTMLCSHFNLINIISICLHMLICYLHLPDKQINKQKIFNTKKYKILKVCQIKGNCFVICKLILLHKSKKYLRSLFLLSNFGTGQIVLWLKVYSTIPDDTCSILSTHITCVKPICNSKSKRIRNLWLIQTSAFFSTLTHTHILSIIKYHILSLF